MLQNIFKIGIRNLLKQKFNSLIKIFGLVIGISSCMLIMIYVLTELNYDRYNEKADQIYRLGFNGKIGDNEIKLPYIGAAAAKNLMNDYPEIIDAVRMHSEGSFMVGYDRKIIKEEKVIFVDPNFLNVFSIRLVQGNNKDVLTKPQSVVITQSTAKKYFGNDNAVGKVIELGTLSSFIVSGVCEDVPYNSHFHFDFFASLISLPISDDDHWTSNSFYTYLVFKKGYNGKDFEAKFPQIINKYIASELEQLSGVSYDKFIQSGQSLGFFLQPLTDIHLKSNLQEEFEVNGSMEFVYIFSIIGLFISLIAAINYINLSTANGAVREKEIGIRKVLGSSRSQLVIQFLMESIIITVVAMAISFVIINLIIPVVNNLTPLKLQIENGRLILLLLLLGIVIGVIAGGYPGLYLSKYKPIEIFRGKMPSSLGSLWGKNLLVIFQFAISTCAIIGTIVIYLQLKYIQDKKLGYDKENILIIHDTYTLDKKLRPFINEVLKNPAIQRASVSNFIPIPPYSRSVNTFQKTEDITSGKAFSMQHWYVDFDYIKTFGMKMHQGRSFSRDFSTDSSAIIINKEAAKLLGWDNPVGKSLKRLLDPNSKDTQEYKIIGVVDNFHFESLREEIAPLALSIGESNSNIILKLNSSSLNKDVKEISKIWLNYSATPFNYSFLDDNFNNVYKKENMMGKIVAAFSIVAVIIASLGLYSLMAFLTQKRVKEIAIRKVLGAQVKDIVILFGKEFAKVIAVALIIALPLAYYYMSSWLNNFAYRISISPQILIASSIITIIIAIITIAHHILKAGRMAPVKSLKVK